MRGSGVGRSPESQSATNAALRAFVHDVVNPIAAIRMSVDTLRARTDLSDGQLADIRRIEKAAGAIIDLVSNLGAPPEVPDVVAPRPTVAARVDLYVLCCDLAERRRFGDGTVIQCRAFGDPRGDWDEAQVRKMLSELLDHAVAQLGRRAPMTLTVTGLARHVRIDIHALGWPTPGKPQTSLDLSPAVGRVPPSTLISAVAPRTGGIILRLRLPRWRPSIPQAEPAITTRSKTP